jgi:hypothetical protein
MNATVKRIAHGKWQVMVGDVVVSMKKNKSDAQALARDLASPGSFLDTTSDDIDLGGPDGSSANPYPAEKLPGTPHE